MKGKTNPISIRLNENDFTLAQNKSGIKKPQKLIDFLLSEYVQEFKSKYIPLPKDYLEIKEIGFLSKEGEIKPLIFPKASKKVPKQKKLQSKVIYTDHPKEAYDAPQMPKDIQDKLTLGKPLNLDELKELCPAELTGFDRSNWIANERQKYGI